MIAKSVAAILQGMGPGGFRGGKASVTVPSPVSSATIVFNQPLNCGMCRIQAKGFTAGGGFVSATLVGSDGTNTWNLAYMAPPTAGTAGQYVSVLLPFICDGNLTQVIAQITFTAAPTGGTPQVDMEVWGASM